jgi:transposase-like protein
MARTSFDVPVSIITLMEQFDEDSECRDVLEKLRWPEGVTCPRCESEKVYRANPRKQFDCAGCGYQFSVTSGTVFHDTHLPLPKWFIAVYLMTESRKGISANQMKRMLKVSYKTAWYLCHRIRSTMKEVNAEVLAGIIEADETWIGGRQKGVGKGNWRTGKTMVLGAMARGGQVRLKVDKRPTKQAVHRFLRTAVDNDSTLYTDEHSAYIGFVDDGKHDYITHRDDEWVRGDVHVNSVEGVWSLLKRSVVDSYHQLSAKHLQAYVDEFAFRFNNRHNEYLFRDTLMKLVGAETLPYQQLIA